MKRFVLLHHYLETGFVSIVAFSDSMRELCELKLDSPDYGSSRHVFYILENDKILSPSLSRIKDACITNICKNVAEYLTVAEYAMLKKSCFKSASWFDKAKNYASLGAVILDNY